MDHFESLRLFRTIVKVRNFRWTGQMLGVSPIVVSGAITSLEERLGARLLHRSTKQFSLTDATHRFYDECCRVFGGLDRPESGTRSQGHLPVDVLQLVAHTSATSAWLAPLVSSSRRIHPNLVVDVTLAEGVVDLATGGYDIGLVLPFMLAIDLTMTRMLQRLPLVIVAAPNYLESHMCPSHPVSPSNHAFVIIPPSVHKPIVALHAEDAPLMVPLRYETTSNNAALDHGVVLVGLGTGLLPLVLTEGDLRKGRLVRLLGDHEVLGTTAEARLVYMNRMMVPARVGAFIDHTIAYFEGE